MNVSTAIGTDGHVANGFAFSFHTPGGEMKIEITETTEQVHAYCKEYLARHPNLLPPRFDVDEMRKLRYAAIRERWGDVDPAALLEQARVNSLVAVGYRGAALECEMKRNEAVYDVEKLNALIRKAEESGVDPRTILWDQALA
jgi:hypothetical protein